MDIEQEKLSAAQSGDLRFLAFTLGEQMYALPLLTVKEVVAIPDTTRVPYTPPYFLGIMNLRGQVISVFDLRLKFGIEAQNTTETAVIICDLSPICFGIVVNAVDSVLSLTQADISEKPDLENSKTNECISGVTRKGEDLVLMLDIAKALNLQNVVAAQIQVPKAA